MVTEIWLCIIQKKGDSMAKKKTVMTDATVDAFEQMVGSATVAPGKKKDNKPAIILNKADSDCLIRFLVECRDIIRSEWYQHGK